MLKRLLQIKLKFLAHLLIKKYKPLIIGITGSVGKTSAKEAIALILKNKFKIRTSFKNYNNEIGLPLVIIGQTSPGRSPIDWLRLFIKAVGLCLIRDKNYPNVLILEMGVDRPGDMEYLTKIAPPNIGLVTSVSYSHLEYFGSLINIQKEKQVLIEKLNSQGVAVLNFDNDKSREMSQVSRAKIITYGFKEGADLQAQDIVYNFTKRGYDLSGINFKLSYQGAIVPVMMKNVMSEPAIYSALAALAVGLGLGLNLVDMANALRDYAMPKGRMNLLAGIKHSFLVDDTYNSSPEAAILAVQTLAKIKIDDSSDKYAVLGDMLEIGTYTEEGHRLVGREVCLSGIKYLIAVGERARDFIRGAKEVGMEDDFIFYFDKPDEAGKFLQNRIKAGDVLLIKGSQGARMEKVVKELMAEPDRASELIVRQEKEWQR